MHLELQRSFSPFTETRPTISGERPYDQALVQGHLTWKDIQSRRVAVVLGEAGIGKTVEFQLEAKRLRDAQRPAFFISLSLLESSGDWDLALGGTLGAFLEWEAGNEEGFFLLDAVDEARLQSHSDFIRALRIVQRRLFAHLGRTRFVLSSRITDWTVPEVAATVAAELVNPIVDACLETTGLPGNRTADPQVPEEEVGLALVVTLDPLSREDARRCGKHFGICEEAGFWDAIESGGYDFMTSRPLDLRWMVDLWNGRRRLGTYAELIEANIEARLEEANPSYQQTGKVLSKQQLRMGATTLAAAAEFGGHAFIAIRPGGVGDDVINAHIVLHDWVPSDVQVLLSSALFDEASLGRVRFHHRTVREYMAACWVDHELHKGVPLHRIWPLFTGQPFDELVIIPGRRATLSWLAAINVRVRSWVISRFPELLLYDGDPESWDQISVDEALKAFVHNSKSIHQPGWLIGRGASARVARVVTPASVVAILADSGASPEARSLAYDLVKLGKLVDCAGIVFARYQEANHLHWETARALSAIEVIGTAEHRAHVLRYLESKEFLDSNTVSECLPVIDWRALPVARLKAIFDKCESEVEYEGAGPITMTCEESLLPSASIMDTQLLLEAVLESAVSFRSALPVVEPSFMDEPDPDWRVNVLITCVAQLLEQTLRERQLPPQVCVKAAVLIDNWRIVGLVSQKDVLSLRAAIEALPILRWQIVCALANSEPISFSKGRLGRDPSCIVTLTATDINELMDRARSATSMPGGQELWFELLIEVSSRLHSGFERASVLRLLRPFTGSNIKVVRDQYRQMRALAQSSRRIAAAQRNKAERQPTQLVVPTLHGERADIETRLHVQRASIVGGEDLPILLRLVNLSNPTGRMPDGQAVDVGAVEVAFGAELAADFRQGLAASLGKVVLDSPLFYARTRRPQRPMPLRIAEAAVDLWIADGTNCASLSATQVAVVAQVASWSSAATSQWFQQLCEKRTNEVVTSLMPWLLEDARTPRGGGVQHATLALALESPDEVCHQLLTAVIPLIRGDEIGDGEILKRLIGAIQERHVIPENEVDALYRQALERQRDPSGRIRDLSLHRSWLATRGRIAWDWFSCHLSALGDQRVHQIDDFAKAMWEDLMWVWETWRIPEPTGAELLTTMLEGLFGPSSGCRPSSGIYGASEDDVADPMYFLGIRYLAAMRGPVGRQALLKLEATLDDPERRRHLSACLIEHAGREAAAAACWRPERLRDLYKIFDSAPASEAQLFEQVIGRLEEIRTTVEEGPFSERVLFRTGMPEKHLQLWLAAKLQDTQNLRFSVHREEEVDDDKRTDIQCACAAGKVCVEIKPLDKTRGYSATSLVEDTLKRQIVGQYLKGRNTSRGILVLMQLDDKRWEVPKKTAGSFKELVEHVQSEAKKVKASDSSVAELLVFGIQCIV